MSVLLTLEVNESYRRFLNFDRAFLDCYFTEERPLTDQKLCGFLDEVFYLVENEAGRVINT